MNISKILLIAALLSTSTLWAQPDEYIHEVEDSPTSMAALFDDKEVKPTDSMSASAAETTMSDVVEPVQVKKPTRGMASVANYDCAGAGARITKGESLTKKEMATYKKLCK
ncbi:MAG: hypothetical protein ABL930_06945 [Pseudobdellovibrio sp.]